MPNICILGTKNGNGLGGGFALVPNLPGKSSIIGSTNATLICSLSGQSPRNLLHILLCSRRLLFALLLGFGVGAGVASRRVASLA